MPNENIDVLQALYDTVIERRDNPQEKSYTCYLLDTGLDKILKKVGEECSETIIAAKNDSDSDLVGEISDLLYHLKQLIAFLTEISKRICFFIGMSFFMLQIPSKYCKIYIY